MRWLCLILVGGLLCSACTNRKTATTGQSSASGKTKPRATFRQGAQDLSAAARTTSPSLSVTNGNTVLTLADTVVGKVVSVNTASRFVILDYSLNQLPELGARLSVYRQGVKVGEIKITGPERNHIIAADILAGEAQPGDLVRSN